MSSTDKGTKDVGTVCASPQLAIQGVLLTLSPKGTDGDIDSKDGEENTRYKIVVNQFDPDTGERVDIEKTASKPKSDAAEKGTERAFTFRKFLNPVGDDALKLGGSEVKIESEPLQALLGRATFRYWKNSKVTEMTSPYHTLIYCWDVANDLAKNPKPDESMEDAQARKDLEKLLLLISTSSGNEIVDKYFKDRETLIKTQTITFDALWTLFPRGTEIVGRPFQGQEQLFLVSYCDAPPDLIPGEARESFNIYCYGYDWDGFFRRRVLYRVSIERFPDKKYIFELPYYPLQYHQDRQGSGMEGKSNEDAIRRLRETLEDRGRKFWDYSTRPQGKQMLSYDGVGYHQRGAGLFHAATPSGIADDSRSFFGGSSEDDARTDAGSAKLYVKGTVVVDFKSFYAYQSTKQTLLGDMTTDSGFLDCDCGDCRLKYEELSRFSWDRRKDMPTKEQFQFLPPRVLGYALEQKRWVQVGVKDLREPPEANRTSNTGCSPTLIAVMPPETGRLFLLPHRRHYLRGWHTADVGGQKPTLSPNCSCTMTTRSSSGGPSRRTARTRRIILLTTHRTRAKA